MIWIFIQITSFSEEQFEIQSNVAGSDFKWYGIRIIQMIAMGFEHHALDLMLFNFLSILNDF